MDTEILSGHREITFLSKMFNPHHSYTVVYDSWATVGASKYVIHKLLLNRATTENQKQLKYRVIGPSLNGYIHKTLLHLKLRDIAWKLVEILIINFMTFKFSYVLIYIYSFNNVCNVSMCLPVDKSRLWNNRWKNSQLKLYLLSTSLDWDSVSCLWPLGNEIQEWHNEHSPSGFQIILHDTSASLYLYETYTHNTFY